MEGVSEILTIEVALGSDEFGNPKSRHSRDRNFVRTREKIAMPPTSKRKYGKKASEKVRRAMHERKRGKLKSGKSGKTVKSRKQAIAIGLSEARKAGAKVPKKS